MSTVTVSEARAFGKDLPISIKFACEVCSFIRGRPLAAVRRDLQATIDLVRPIPFKRYRKDLCHKAGKLGAARFPVKASSAILNLVNSAVANASSLGLSVDKLVVSFAVANMGSQRWHYGRHSRRLMKRAHVEIRVREAGVVSS